MSQGDIYIQHSNGNSSKIVRYVRPIYVCSNRSRRITGYTSSEVNEKIENVISKWYAPKVILYKIQGITIGSNSKQNALKEYWKVCPLEDHGKQFEVDSFGE